MSLTHSPSKIHAQSAAVECMLVGKHPYAWWATSDATAAAVEFILQQTTGPTCSGPVSAAEPTREAESSDFDSLIRGFPLSAVLLNQTSLTYPDEHNRFRTCLWWRQVPAVQSQWHSALPRRNAGLPSPSADVGTLCARNQTRCELYPQSVLRPCHHQVQLPNWRRWWTYHIHPHHSISYRVWWHTPKRRLGGSSGSWSRPRGINTSCPRNYVLDFDALLEDCGEQMVLGDFKAHHPSWFTMPGNGRATARGEVLDWAINSSQLAVANHPSWAHLLPNVTLSTLTTLGSDHLPISISLSSHARPHRGKLVLTRTSARLTGRDSQQSQRGYSLRHHCMPTSCSSGGKILPAYSYAVMLGFTAALSPMLCDPSSRRKISVASMTLYPSIKLLDRDIQRNILQEAQDQWRTLLESSDRATNHKRYRSLLRKLGGKR